MQPNRLRLLKVAEYTSLAASVVGVVISTASRQVVYAAAPLSVSVFLSLLNRQRFEQQTQQSLTATMAQVSRQLSQLNQAFSHLQQEVTSELSQQLSELDAKVTSEQQVRLEVSRQLSQLNQAFSHLQQEVTSELSQRLSELDARVTLEQQVRLDLSAAITQVEQRLSQFNQRVSDDIQSVRQQINSQASVLNPAALQVIQQRLCELQNRINSLEALNLGLVPENIAQLMVQYDSLLASASRMDQRLDSFPSIEQVNSIQTQTDQLQVELRQLQTALQQQQDNLQAAITSLSYTFAQVQAELQERLLQSLESSTGDDTGGDEDDTEQELEPLDLNLGIDFGTSFTKVCFRDIARDRSEIVTFTDGQADLDEALLPTKIGILPDGKLLAGLTTAEWAALEQPFQTSVEFIKMRLADLDISQNSEQWRLEHLPELDRPETVENLCAYYLSRVIIRAQSWIRRNKPELVLNQKIEWAANVGVPVEYCDSPAIARFEKVLSLAWLLSNEPQTELFTIERLGDRLQKLRPLLSNAPIDCHAIPELSAAVWSFLNSREAKEGFYTFFDVGDGTFDGVSFLYWREDGEPKVDFYSAEVKPLGVSALSQCLAAELNASEIEMRSVIFNQSDSGLAKMNSSRSRNQIQIAVATVVMDGRENHGNHRPLFKQSEFQKGLSVFIGGGGGKTNFYKTAIISTHADFQHKRAGIPAYIQKDIPTPKDLSMSGLNSKEFHRFAVAYGLSILKDDCPDVRLPSEMVKAESQRLKTTSGTDRIRYEDTRDSC